MQLHELLLLVLLLLILLLLHRRIIDRRGHGHVLLRLLRILVDGGEVLFQRLFLRLQVLDVVLNALRMQLVMQHGIYLVLTRHLQRHGHQRMRLLRWSMQEWSGELLQLLLLLQLLQLLLVLLQHQLLLLLQLLHLCRLCYRRPHG